LLAIDAFAWVLSILAIAVLEPGAEALPALAVFAWGAALLQAVVGALVGLYRGRYRFGSLDELLALGIVTVIVTMVAGTVSAVFGEAWGLPGASGLLAGALTISMTGGVRVVTRAVTDRRRRLPSEGAMRTLVYGAGEAGIGLVDRLVSEPDAQFLPVGFIDDSSRKRNFTHGSLRVLGTGDTLAEVVAQADAEAIVIAIGRADAALLRRVSDSLSGLPVQIKVLPPFSQILRGGAHYWDLRDIEIEDLIGRSPIETDVAAISDYVAGARVLVTGAGGSIGSELAVQLARFAPSQLVLLDRDETGLQQTQIAIDGNGLLTSEGIVLADIRDAAKVQEVFERVRPDVVFHAAALKHLTLLERFPEEAWQTNVLGTLHVLRAAQSVGTKIVVNVSTDKAANPTSVLGYSKRMAERLTAFFAIRGGLRFVSVRFGNVIGSRGSMLPTFVRLIGAGGPVTVTDPDATRYFMTIPEACQLVIQAGAIAHGGEVLVLDMGEPVRIQDIARRMISMSGKDIEIVYTGLRPGEKLHEELMGTGEVDERPFHPLISHTVVPPIDPDQLDFDIWSAALGGADGAEDRPPSSSESELDTSVPGVHETPSSTK
jgi:dTDP-glucose 4,6-dehydratase